MLPREREKRGTSFSSELGRGEAEFEERSDEGLGFAEVPAGFEEMPPISTILGQNGPKKADFG